MLRYDFVKIKFSPISILYSSIKKRPFNFTTHEFRISISQFLFSLWKGFLLKVTLPGKIIIIIIARAWKVILLFIFGFVGKSNWIIGASHISVFQLPRPYFWPWTIFLFFYWFFKGRNKNHHHTTASLVFTLAWEKVHLTRFGCLLTFIRLLVKVHNLNFILPVDT